jgi:clan AA aspartic protease (TIGR02281 family)
MPISHIVIRAALRLSRGLDRAATTFAALSLLLAMPVAAVHAETPEPASIAALRQLSQSSDGEIRRLAEQLQDHFCNQPAVLRVMQRLHKDLNYKPATDIGEEFVTKCDKDVTIGYLTAQGWARLTDFGRALVAINRFPSEVASSGHFAAWRGFILEKLNRNLEAAADFERALYLFPDIRKLPAAQFNHVTRNLKAAGRYCEAIRPMELFVSFDPEKRRETAIETVISELGRLGKCAPEVPSGQAVVKLQPRAGVFLVDGEINGVKAVFVLDTGAAAIHLTREFATKAGLKTREDAMVTVIGLTGTRKDYLTKAEKVALGPVIARDVTATVASDSASFGEGIDGLLGQTFLSRFKVNIDAAAKTLSLVARK